MRRVSMSSRSAGIDFLLGRSFLSQGRTGRRRADIPRQEFSGPGASRVAKTIAIYGIKNCDTMKKARAWLDGHGVAYDFHDYKAAGIERSRLEGWAAKVGWESLLNRAGTTFRKLPDKDKEGLTEKKAIALMIAQPLDDQAAGARCRRQAVGRLQARTVCGNIE